MSTNEKPSKQMIDLADRLYAAHLPDNFGAKDVLIWYSNRGINVAFRGDALRMERANFGEKVRKNNKGETVEYWDSPGNVLHIRTLLSRYLEIPYDHIHSMEDNYEHISDLKYGIQDTLRSFLDNNGQNLIGIEEVFWTLMPKEGEPWNIGDEFTYYYSASKKKILHGHAPRDIYQVQLDEGEFMAANVCAVLPTFVAPKSAIVGVLPNGETIFASHTFSSEKHKEEEMKAVAANIIKCGGLIFPSLALGQIAANAFGRITLISYLDFTLSSMRPYKQKKGAWQVTVYDTDAWTGRTSQFVGEGATELFEQLTGDWSIPASSYNLHFWTLGPPITTGPAEAKVVPDTKKLSNIIKKRMKAWSRNATEENLEIAMHKDVRNRYPYLEVKVNGVYSIKSFPLAVVEKARYEISKAFLIDMGWSGDLVVVDEESRSFYKPNPIVGFSSGLLEYSWLVHDAVVSYTESTGLIEAVLI